MAAKRKNKEVTLQTKYEALQEIEKERHNKDVANQFGILVSTHFIWKKREEKFSELFKPILYPAHLFTIRERQKRGPGTLKTRD